MKRSAFTLIEIVISIFLLSLIIIFVSESLSNLSSSQKIVDKIVNNESLENKLTKTLYYDLFFAKNIKITGGKNYSILYLTTQNSLFNIDYPYVIWYVLKNNNTLCRLESAYKINLPLYPEDFYKVNVSKVLTQCEIFKIYKSKDKIRFLIYIKTKNKPPITLELYKPDTN